jgi:predicted GNAT family acetyltransferase
MPDDQPRYEVIHNAARSRFEATVEGLTCVADYRLQGGVMQMTHTGVPPQLEGRGIAAALVRAAMDFARAQGHKVHPACSYVAAYMRRHPETQDLLA